jgi:WD40 repeat protein
VVVHGPHGKESRRETGPINTPAKFIYDCTFGHADDACEFSPDGQRLAYSLVLRAVHVAERLFGRDTSCRLMMDDVPIGEGQQLKWPAFSPDSKSLAFPVKRSGKWYVVVHGQEEGAYDDIHDGWDALGRKRQLFFSPDGKRLGYCAKKEGQWFAVVDGTLEVPYAELGRPVFSPDSSHEAHRAKREGKWLVVVDGRPGMPYDEIAKEAVSDRGWLREEVSFSSGGARIVYRAKSGGKWFAVVGGRAGPAYDEMAPPALSPDSQHVAYAARRKDTWVLIVDGIEAGEYDFLTDRRVVFDGPRQFHTVIQRGAEYLLLEVEIPAS